VKGSHIIKQGCHPDVIPNFMVQYINQSTTMIQKPRTLIRIFNSLGEFQSEKELTFNNTNFKNVDISNLISGEVLRISLRIMSIILY